MRNLFLILLITISTGCSTYFHGTSSPILIQTIPPGAKVSINGIECGTTPFVSKIGHSFYKEKITIEKEGFETHTQAINKKFRYSTLIPIPFLAFACYSLPVDYISRSMYASDPTNIYLPLKPLDTTSTDLSNAYVHCVQTKTGKIAINPNEVYGMRKTNYFQLFLPRLDSEEPFIVNEKNLEDIAFIRINNKRFFKSKALYPVSDVTGTVTKVKSKNLEKFDLLSHDAPKVKDLAGEEDLKGGFFGAEENAITKKPRKRAGKYYFEKKKAKNPKKNKSVVIYNQLIWPIDFAKLVVKKQKESGPKNANFRMSSVLGQTNTNKLVAVKREELSSGRQANGAASYNSRYVFDLYYVTADKLYRIDKKNYKKYISKFNSNPYIKELYTKNKNPNGFEKELTNEVTLAKILIWTSNNIESTLGINELDPDIEEETEPQVKPKKKVASKS